MSGFEVAGIVLGALPLLISGLEHYRDGLDSVRAASNYREVVADLIVTFRVITAGYQTICERALRQLMLADEEYIELLDDPSGKKWKEYGIDAGIRQCLGANYRPFVDVTGRLHRDIVKFADKMMLDTEHDLKPQWLLEDSTGPLHKKLTSKSSKLLKIIKIGLESGKIADRLRKIDDDLRYLERIVPENLNASMTTTRIDTQKKSIWKDVRESAKHLFDAIMRNSTCNKHIHTTSLRLEARDSPLALTQRPRFKFLVSQHTVANQPAPSQSEWHNVEIEPADTGANVLLPSPPPAPSIPLVGKSSKKKSVSMAAIRASFAGPSVTLTSATSLTITSSPATVKIFKSLCHCLREAGNRTGCVGILENQSWHHQIFRSSQVRTSSPSWRTFRERMSGIQTSLAGQVGQSAFEEMTLPEKYRMSYVLASSVLQLADTPWLSEGWRLRDVYFNSSDPLPHPDHPYLRTELASESPKTPNPSLLNRCISNEMTFTLGVVLIELFYGSTLDSLRRDEDLDSDGGLTPMTDLLTATRLVGGVRTKGGPNIADAIERCIYGRFSSAGLTFENTALQGQFYEGVIAPLKNILDAL